MAKCPFAKWNPLGGSAGQFTSGPFKIVHHSTESSSTEGSLSELGKKHVESHFVVDDKTIYQLIDTGVAAKSLRNAPGGVETNRDSAIQIEMVGFAGKPKNRATLANVRKLCRWLEATHNIPRVWPNGYPLPAVNGQDPEGKKVNGVVLHHNRDAKTWDTKGGHYCHSQVPENIHWDAAYTKEEVDFLMADADAGP